jgi:putative addiction module component (TIGR02574 family)
MATEAFERIRNEINALSSTERAELADELIKSLDGTCGQDVEDAWEREILRRVELIDSGQAELLDRAAFGERMHGRSLSVK